MRLNLGHLGASARRNIEVQRDSRSESESEPEFNGKKEKKKMVNDVGTRQERGGEGGGKSIPVASKRTERKQRRFPDGAELTTDRSRGRQQNWTEATYFCGAGTDSQKIARRKSGRAERPYALPLRRIIGVPVEREILRQHCYLTICAALRGGALASTEGIDSVDVDGGVPSRTPCELRCSRQGGEARAVPVWSHSDCRTDQHINKGAERAEQENALVLSVGCSPASLAFTRNTLVGFPQTARIGGPAPIDLLCLLGDAISSNLSTGRPCQIPPRFVFAAVLRLVPDAPTVLHFPFSFYPRAQRSSIPVPHRRALVPHMSFLRGIAVLNKLKIKNVRIARLPHADEQDMIYSFRARRPVATVSVPSVEPFTLFASKQVVTASSIGPEGRSSGASKHLVVHSTSMPERHRLILQVASKCLRWLALNLMLFLLPLHSGSLTILTLGACFGICGHQNPYQLAYVLTYFVICSGSVNVVIGDPLNICSITSDVAVALLGELAPPLCSAWAPKMLVAVLRAGFPRRHHQIDRVTMGS
ncbi:hypothetical protein K438DRAFT_1757232 [Mycena galopus ATCC 62051]|nr:hypothetical protein K438DRAFT_1757232 [Mycena galopus ATCC 62051]